MKKTCRILIFSIIAISMTGISRAQVWESYTHENSELVSNDVRSVSVDSLGIKWFGTDSGLSSFNGSAWRTVQADGNKKTLAHNSVNDIVAELIGGNTEIWAATDSGVSVIGVEVDAITMATPYYKENTGLISNGVNAAFADKFHIKWFGTDSGLSRFDGGDWHSFTAGDTVAANNILSIGADTAGWKYIGTKGGGVSRIFDNGVDAITTASPLEYDWCEIPSDSVYAVYVMDNGDQWFGTDQGAAFHAGRDNDYGWTLYSTSDGLVHNFVQTIAVSKDSVILLGTPEGLSCFKNSSWKTITTDGGLVGNDVRDIAVDRDGSLWFATNQGVSHFTGNIVSIKKILPFVAISDYRLYPNYPNPFNPTTWIQYNLPVANYVELNIYDLQGRKVASLVSQKQSAGSHRVEWNAGGLASGVYLYRIITDGGFVQTRKLILLK